MDDVTKSWMKPIGNRNAPILVICDSPPPSLAKSRAPISEAHYGVFKEAYLSLGFVRDDFYFIAPSPTIPNEFYHSDKKKTEFLRQYHDSFMEEVNSLDPKVILLLGNNAAKQYFNKPVQITKLRGQITVRNDKVLFPMFAPGHVLRQPQYQELYVADFQLLARLRDNDFIPGAIEYLEGTNYEWRTDISDILEHVDNTDEPQIIAVDTETTGLRWQRAEERVLTVQISYKEGHSVVCPVHPGFWDFKEGEEAHIRGQLKELLENPKVEKVGHNLSFDNHMLVNEGIFMRSWTHDTQQLAFVVDDNMKDKSLAECTRRWIPALAGYSDEFDATVDKSKMIEVPKEKFLPYAGGDTDACLRLFNRLLPVAMEDERQYNLYERIQMPAILTFSCVVERRGMPFRSNNLAEFERYVSRKEIRDYENLLALFKAEAKNPHKVIRKHLEKCAKAVSKHGKRAALSFSRDEFIRDMLFSPDGLGLKPRMFTKSTAKLERKERVPQAGQDHLAFFSEHSEFCRKLVEYKKLTKIQSTYIRGFWEHIYNERIHPSFMLHRTVTGRAASENPNGQNLPKRGSLAKVYRQIFEAQEGYKLIEVDLSQAELRMVAWMAREPEMLRIYREGGDIHTETAAQIMGKTVAEFMLLDDETRDYKRFCAKSVNFGFIYGMSAEGFQTYAKTDYGLTFTIEEAAAIRNAFFKKYAGLEKWHKAMRDFVNEHGYVRSLHGALRRLPDIDSDDSGVVSLAIRQAINAPIQRIASDLGLIAMVRFTRDADLTKYCPIGFIHDALIIETKDEYVAEAAGAIRWYMENTPLKKWFNVDCPIPILADCKVGQNLKSLRDYQVEATKPDFFVEGRDLENQAQFFSTVVEILN